MKETRHQRLTEIGFVWQPNLATNKKGGEFKKGAEKCSQASGLAVESGDSGDAVAQAWDSLLDPKVRFWIGRTVFTAVSFPMNDDHPEPAASSPISDVVVPRRKQWS